MNRQLTTFSGYIADLQSHMISQDVHVRRSELSCACAFADALVIKPAAPQRNIDYREVFLSV